MPVNPDEAGPTRLLELLCDWYWTTDDQWRLMSLDSRHLAQGPSTILTQLGKAPWDWPGVVTTGPDLEKLRDAMLRHQDLDDLQYTWRDRRGQLRYMALWGEPMFDAELRFLGYRGAMREVTQRRRAEALVALEHRVTRGLAEAATSRKILQAVMRIICESEQWDTGGYFRIEDAEGTARLVVGWLGPGMADHAANYYRQIADKIVPPGGQLSKVAASGQPLWVEAMTESQTTWGQRLQRTGERAALFCPVLVDHRVIGIFAFASHEIREPDTGLLQTLRVIGEQVGQFLKRKEAEQVLRESEARFRALTQLSSDWYWEIDTDFRFTRIEGQHGEGDAATGGSVIGKTRWETRLVSEEAGGWSAHRARLDAHMPFRDLVLLLPLSDRGKRYISLSGEPMHDERGVFLGYRGVGRDVTQRKLAENHIQHLATHDGLTGLPNRTLFSEQLELAIRLARRTGLKIALLFIDLDGFKEVNDACGHNAGDVVLKEMARRFTYCLRNTDVVARLGGDEFVALLQQVDGDDDVAAIARKILATAARPVLLQDRQFHVTASIGISMYGDGASDELSLMRNADSAMYAAKRNGKNEIRFYSATSMPSGS